MKIHPRTRVVQEAQNAIANELDSIAEAKKLTAVEMLQILNGYQATYLKFMLRRERHPNNPSKPADEL